MTTWIRDNENPTLWAVMRREGLTWQIVHNSHGHAMVYLSLQTAMTQADRLRRQAERDAIRVTKYDYSAEIVY
ncbi:hypothetical protein lacNasYZ03_11480 [Lactobacillus nasalidis]|uniref:Uncharacterized protein n=1 Tax=Lactobacillus nasalidis TaxID=2797258 RepID=A0ABQ3W7F6_9LACO|nr:hypothetical protein lacNasYZ01_10540 [Lactobacillus nasalidis]GHW00102.1 hypothetical protein lacNasYZ02_15310 [Lactobacillus nasalidis]GHW01461.1 hypothetical protein lacNasYZ03_11480 [Lactobacillus nasalidis]